MTIDDLEAFVRRGLAAQQAADRLTNPTPLTYELGLHGSRATIRCLLCDAISANPGDVGNRYCARCHLFHDAVANGRRLVALGSFGHTCDDWPTARNVCALCGAGVARSREP